MNTLHAPSENRKLKRALILSAFAAMQDSTSRSHDGKGDSTSRSHDGKGAEGTKHNAALICLSRGRRDVLLAPRNMRHSNR